MALGGCIYLRMQVQSLYRDSRIGNYFRPSNPSDNACLFRTVKHVMRSRHISEFALKKSEDLRISKINNQRLGSPISNV